MTSKDPVVRDITQYINRSAGQHQRRISEGTESVARLLRLPVVDTMTPDPYLLHRTHRVDTRDLAADDGVSVGGCCTHDCDEGRDCPLSVDAYEFNPWWARSIAVLVLLAVACIALAPEIAGLLSALNH